MIHVQLVAENKGTWATYHFGFPCQFSFHKPPLFANLPTTQTYKISTMFISATIATEMFFYFITIFYHNMFRPLGAILRRNITSVILYGAINATMDPLCCDCLDMWCEPYLSQYTGCEQYICLSTPAVNHLCLSTPAVSSTSVSVHRL
jgi:hypothetical protein